MQDIIEEAQAKIINIYHDNIEKELPYNQYVIPIITPIIQVLKSTPPEKWFRKETTDVHIDAYVEALSLYMLYNYIHDINIEYPLFAVVLVLVKHTFFIHIFQYKKNVEEWNAYRKLLFTEFEIIKKSIPNIRGITNLQSLIKEDIEIPDHPTSIYLYNQLFGFAYTEENISINSVELLTTLQPNSDSGFMLIHLSYNIKVLQSIILCKPIHKNPSRILNINNIQNKKPFQHPESIFVSNAPYTLCDTEFAVLSSTVEKTNWYILLCYDDADTLNKCHYTLIDKMMSNTEINNVVNCRIINKIDYRIFNTVLHDDYVSNISFKTDPSEVIAKNTNNMLTIIKRVFNNARDQQDFVNKLLLERNDLLTIIDESEFPYFKIFMSKYAKGSIFDYDSARNYVSSYFGVDTTLMIGDSA